MTLRVHDIRINGVPVEADGYSWTWLFTTGARPHVMKILVPTSREKEFWPLMRGKPLTFSVNATRSSPEGTKAEQHTISNLWMLAPTPTRIGIEEVSELRLADTRWFWQHRAISGRFNHSIRVNDADIARAGQPLNVPSQGATEARGGFAPAKPYGENNALIGFKGADVIGENIIVPKVAWRRLTINPDTDQPWTALELILGFLNGYRVNAVGGGTHSVKGILRDDEPRAEYKGRRGDNLYNPPRLDYGGTPANAVIDELLPLARVRMFVSVAGAVTLYDYDQDAEPELPPFSEIEDSPRMFMTDNSDVRALKVRVPFMRESEIRYYAEQEGDERTDKTVPVGAEQAAPEPKYKQVMRLPSNQTLSIDGQPAREYAAGTIVPMKAVLEQVMGISFDWLRKYFFSDSELVSIYAIQILGLQDPSQVPDEWLNLLAEARKAYRQMFQLDDRWIEQIIDLSGDSVIVVDPITGKRAPSSVWSDYTIIRTTRTGKNIIPKHWKMWDYVEYERKESGSAEPADDAEPGPYTASVLDKELGLFQLSPQTSYHGFIHRIIPGKARSPNGEPLNIIPVEIAHAIQNLQLDDDFGCACELTVTTMEPNTEGQFHVVEVSAGEVGAGGAGAVVETHTMPLIRDETARFARDGKLVNEKMIRARALNEARLYYQSIQDRIANTAPTIWSGLHLLYPFGPVNATGWMMDSNGQLSTMVDAIERQPTQIIDQLLPRDLRHERMHIPPAQT